MKDQYQKSGYIILRQFFAKEKIEKIVAEAKKVFEIQFHKFGYEGDFNEKMIKLFREHEELFMNCGKMIQQGLLELYELSTDHTLIEKVKELGLDFPLMCTRPVLFFNHPKLARTEVYYKTPLHQDWPSMEASLDSVVVWVPLIDVDEANGSIYIYPKSHKLGDISDSVEGGFAVVKKYDLSSFDEIQPKLKQGDIVIFSSFLLHKSGEITNDSIRWSCHLRYTNMLDQDFIDRGFPHPYVYKPKIKKDS